MEPITLNSKTPVQLLSEIEEICGKELHVFRGENNTYEHVSSSIFRRYSKLFSRSDDFIPLDVEKEIVEKARILHFSENVPVDEILTDIRHFGGDTTLIDFTRSLLIALFFGCNGKFDDDGRIIVVPTKRIPNKFNVELYESQATVDLYSGKDKREITEEERMANRESEKKLSFLNPARTMNSRARTEFQSSIFIHAPQGCIDYAESGHISINIPRKLKLACLEYLDRRQNIRHDTIYNDLTGYIENERNSEIGARWFYFGLSRLRSKKYDRAEKCFGRSIRHNPNMARVWTNKGRANFILEKYDEAQNDLARADELIITSRK